MSDTQPETETQSAGGKLVNVVLDEGSIARSTPEVEHDRAVAIYDLIEDNRFQPVGHPSVNYVLNISVVEKRLVLQIRTEDEHEVVTHVLSLSPLRKIVKDYDLICESYYEAIRHSTPSQIEAIDMGRRGVHNEGSAVLMERLEGKVEVDMQTARRLFTLVYALHWKG
ncbi:hypothetical protein LP7551_04302 [Roseibium album]|nr:hypothetical protein LP7551_04302 [Roseibium album]